MSFKTKLPTLPEAFNDPQFFTVTIQRDLFYGYDMLMKMSQVILIQILHNVTGMRGRTKPLSLKLREFSGLNSETPKITVSTIVPFYYKVQVNYFSLQFQELHGSRFASCSLSIDT